MRSYWILALLIAASMASAAQLYRWVDEDGVVHFSDTPQPGAEAVEVPDAQTFSAPPIPASPAAGEPSEQPTASFRYRAIQIASPQEDETLWNIEGRLNVGVTLDPALQPGHQLRLYFDGQAVDAAGSGSSFQVENVYRGAHTLWAVVNDANGRPLQRSDTRTFFVQQTSVAN